MAKGPWSFGGDGSCKGTELWDSFFNSLLTDVFCPPLHSSTLKSMIFFARIMGTIMGRWHMKLAGAGRCGLHQAVLSVHARILFRSEGIAEQCQTCSSFWHACACSIEGEYIMAWSGNIMLGTTWNMVKSKLDLFRRVWYQQLVRKCGKWLAALDLLQSMEDWLRILSSNHAPIIASGAIWAEHWSFFNGIPAFVNGAT